MGRYIPTWALIDDSFSVSEPIHLSMASLFMWVSFWANTLWEFYCISFLGILAHSIAPLWGFLQLQSGGSIKNYVELKNLQLFINRTMAYTYIYFYGGIRPFRHGQLPKPIWKLFVRFRNSYENLESALKIYIKILGLRPKLNYYPLPLNENPGSAKGYIGNTS